MIYHDKIYGERKIVEPVVLAIIESRAMQRLKHIDRAGYRPLWVNPNATATDEDNSRFSHSVGVYLLLNIYSASLEEQIAGLIHDVSHSAFSHCIDYVLTAGSESHHDHQDNIFEAFIQKTEIPDILGHYGLNLDRIINDDNWPLKENKLPDLCADRIDYVLRDAVCHDVISSNKAKAILRDLKVEGGKWVFIKSDTAKEFAELFLKMNRDYYSGFPSAVMFRAVGDFLKHALAKGYINEGDLYLTDKEVINKIIPFTQSDEQLEIYWQRMNAEIKAVNDKESFEARIVCKSRVVDPLCREGEKIRRVSDIYTEWKETVDQELKPKEYFLRFNK